MRARIRPHASRIVQARSMLAPSPLVAVTSEPVEEMDVFASDSNPAELAGVAIGDQGAANGAVASPPVSVSVKREPDEQTAVTKRVRFVPVAPLDEGDVQQLCGISGCHPALELRPNTSRPTPRSTHTTRPTTLCHPSPAVRRSHTATPHGPLFHGFATHIPPSRARASVVRSAGTTPGSAAWRHSRAERGASATRRSRLWNSAVVSATAHHPWPPAAGLPRLLAAPRTRGEPPSPPPPPRANGGLRCNRAEATGSAAFIAR